MDQIVCTLNTLGSCACPKCLGFDVDYNDVVNAQNSLNSSSNGSTYYVSPKVEDEDDDETETVSNSSHSHSSSVLNHFIDHDDDENSEDEEQKEFFDSSFQQQQQSSQETLLEEQSTSSSSCIESCTATSATTEEISITNSSCVSTSSSSSSCQQQETTTTTTSTSTTSIFSSDTRNRTFEALFSKKKNNKIGNWTIRPQYFIPACTSKYSFVSVDNLRCKIEGKYYESNFWTPGEPKIAHYFSDNSSYPILFPEPSYTFTSNRYKGNFPIFPAHLKNKNDLLSSSSLASSRFFYNRRISTFGTTVSSLSSSKVIVDGAPRHRDILGQVVVQNTLFCLPAPDYDRKSLSLKPLPANPKFFRHSCHRHKKPKKNPKILIWESGHDDRGDKKFDRESTHLDGKFRPTREDKQKKNAGSCDRRRNYFETKRKARDFGNSFNKMNQENSKLHRRAKLMKDFSDEARDIFQQLKQGGKFDF